MGLHARTASGLWTPSPGLTAGSRLEAGPTRGRSCLEADVGGQPLGDVCTPASGIVLKHGNDRPACCFLRLDGMLFLPGYCSGKNRRMSSLPPRACASSSGPSAWAGRNAATSASQTVSGFCWLACPQCTAQDECRVATAHLGRVSRRRAVAAEIMAADDPCRAYCARAPVSGR